MATLGAFFGVLALIIASLGIFGVMAFQVAERTREFGIRLALGATRRAVTALVLRDALLMLFFGCSIGGLAAVEISSIVESLLFGVTPTDPGVFLVAAAILAAVGMGAVYAPAWRAARVNPIVTLRHE
jgi:ABC-type antimicrobial peptide transport system permease subunit